VCGGDDDHALSWLNDTLCRGLRGERHLCGIANGRASRQGAGVRQLISLACSRCRQNQR
jgi:hypothetical protein